MKRLFFALWPSNATRNQVDMINQSINIEGLKKLTHSNLHVTLVFLGNVVTETELMIRQRMKNICVQAFTIHFDQLNVWKKPRVLCVTPQQVDPQLLKLVVAISKEVEQCGVVIDIDKRPYKPHITLARKATELVDIEVPSIEWHAHSFCLVESLSTPAGVQYKVLQTWDFQ